MSPFVVNLGNMFKASSIANHYPKAREKALGTRLYPKQAQKHQNLDFRDFC